MGSTPIHHRPRRRHRGIRPSILIRHRRIMSTRRRMGSTLTRRRPRHHPRGIRPSIRIRHRRIMSTRRPRRSTSTRRPRRSTSTRRPRRSTSIRRHLRHHPLAQQAPMVDPCWPSGPMVDRSPVYLARIVVFRGTCSRACTCEACCGQGMLVACDVCDMRCVVGRCGCTVRPRCPRGRDSIVRRAVPFEGVNL
jgi:hypothetical protein